MGADTKLYVLFLYITQQLTNFRFGHIKRECWIYGILSFPLFSKTYKMYICINIQLNMTAGEVYIV